MKKGIGLASTILGIGLFGLGILYLLEEDYIESESIEHKRKSIGDNQSSLMTEDDFEKIKRSADTVNPILF